MRPTLPRTASAASGLRNPVLAQMPTPAVAVFPWARSAVWILTALCCAFSASQAAADTVVSPHAFLVYRDGKLVWIDPLWDPAPDGAALRQKFLDPAQREKVYGVVMGVLDQLPEHTRLIAQVYVAQFPKTERMEVLSARLSKLTGRKATPESVAKALHEARQAVRAALEHNGFGRAAPDQPRGKGG